MQWGSLPLEQRWNLTAQQALGLNVVHRVELLQVQSLPLWQPAGLKRQ